MKIQRDILFALLPEGTTNVYGYKFITKVIRNTYCNKMNMSDSCTQNCLDCATSIERIFSAAKEANNKEALSTWIAKNEAAKNSEKKHTHEAPQRSKDIYGVPMPETNSLSSLLKEFTD